jgi:hypothetical protein
MINERSFQLSIIGSINQIEKISESMDTFLRPGFRLSRDSNMDDIASRNATNVRSGC